MSGAGAGIDTAGGSNQTPATGGRCREDDNKWPPKNKDGRQELEIQLGNEHISFEVRRRRRRGGVVRARIAVGLTLSPRRRPRSARSST